MRTSTVVFEGKEYPVRELRHRANKKWRKELEDHIGKVATAIESGANIDSSELSSIAHLIREVASFLVGSVDTMSDLLVKYCPTLQEAVEDGFDSEITDAFVEVLKLAYPFSSMITTLKRIGSQLPQTKQS